MSLNNLTAYVIGMNGMKEPWYCLTLDNNIKDTRIPKCVSVHTVTEVKMVSKVCIEL